MNTDQERNCLLFLIIVVLTFISMGTCHIAGDLEDINLTLIKNHGCH